jgi:hypothetical protein
VTGTRRHALPASPSRRRALRTAAGELTRLGLAVGEVEPAGGPSRESARALPANGTCAP